MQVGLLVLIVYGVVDGHPKAISNGTISLGITLLPAVLERNYEFPLDPWLAMWIASAVFLHSLGSAGLYGSIPWWDHLTHALSASLVAGVGYTATRAVDLHSDDITIPTRYAFAYLFVIVLAFGVIWELFEFGLDVLTRATGFPMPLAQHGLEDTVMDLVFNAIGAALVAAFGQAHLRGTAERLLDRYRTAD